MTKKIFAMFLAVLMVVSMLPTSVFAAGTCPAVHTKDNCEYTQVGEPVAPTCGAQGYTRYKCNACGKEFIADQVPAAGEHTWVDAKDEPETCEKDGLTGGKECSVCHAKVDQTKVDKIPNGEGVKCVWEDLTPNIDCTTGGTKQYKCKVCGATKEGAKIEENTPHVWAEDGGDGWKLVAGKTDLAERKCLNCGKVEECVVYAAHDHVYIAVEAVAPKCEKAGVMAHFQCRICEQKFVYGKASETATVDTYNLVTDADLAVKSLHEHIQDTLTCMTTTYPCDKCDEVIKVNKAAAHKYTNGWQNVEEATCTTDGFEKRICTVCGNTETRIIDALGHIETTYTQKATCVQYTYTFKHCLRPGCVDELQKTTTVKINNADVVFDLTVGSSEMTEPLVGIAFYLTVNFNDTLTYLGTSMDGTYAKAETVIDSAARLYLEVAEIEDVEGAYYIYFYDAANEDAKTYVYIYQQPDGKRYVCVGMSTEVPETYFVWNEEHKVMTTHVNDKDYFMGCHPNYGTTMGCYKLSDIENRLPGAMLISNGAGVALLDIDVDTAAGKNPENHADPKKVTTLVPTCKEGVTNTWLCYACSVSWTKEEAKVDHDWIADTTKDCPADCDKTHEHVKDGVQKANCTDKGAKYFVCGFGCGETKVEEEAAKGHSAIYEEKNGVKTDKVFTVVGTHTSVTIYDYKECYYCHEQIEKTNYRVWEGVGKLWTVLACEDGECGECATCAHDGKLAAEAEVEVTGDCSKVGYKGYKCSECGEVVRVKTATTGAHVYSENQHQDPTCTVPGFDVNERCQRCDQLKDKTLEEGKVTELPVIEHDWYTPTKEERKELGWTEEYKAADCDKPNYENWVAYCKDCGELKNDGTKHLNTIVESTAASLCGPVVYEWYTCHCGENHIRNYVGKIAHVYIDAVEGDVEGDLKLDATCTAPGFIWKKCQFCGELKKFDIAQKPHQNKDKVEFVDSCIDTVEDRHCVLCCACADKKDHDCTADQDKDTKGVQTCPCVIPAAQHNWDREDTFVPAHCVALPYSMRVCVDCGKTEITNYPGYWDGETVDAKGNPVLKPIVGLGHTPVAYVEGADKAANLKYLEVTAYDYILVDGTLRQVTTTYTGIYSAYTEATYSAAGSATFVCSQCGEEVTIEIPALSGLGFEMEYINANGHEEVTTGSLVNVTLYAIGNDVAVNNFQLYADFYGMIFVGAQPVNDNFVIRVTEEANANVDGELRIMGSAVNTADKKQQDIIITEKTALVTLQFVVLFEAAIEMDGVAQDLAAKKAEDSIVCNPEDLEIEVQMLLDFNEDEEFTIADLVQAEAILTGESEETYDVVVDMDKDGVITLYDLELVYNFLVNFKVGDISSIEEYVEMLKSVFEFIGTGLSEEHMAIVMEAIDNLLEIEGESECNSSECEATILPGMKYCPECGNRQ